MIRRGCIYWVRYARDKVRPALVISPQSRNQRANDILAMPCSSQLRLGPWHIPLRRGEGGLPSPSVILCEHVGPVPRDWFELPALGGQLSDELMQRVRRSLLMVAGFDDEDLEH